MVEGNKLPLKLPFVSAIFFLVMTVMLQFGSRNGLWAAARSVGYGIIATPYLVWILIIVYVFPKLEFSFINLFLGSIRKHQILLKDTNSIPVSQSKSIL